MVSHEAFKSIPCVVLLGEPGMGKSHEMRRYFGSAREGTGGVLFRDLRQYDSTSAIRDDVFSSRSFQAWESGDAPLTLVLDSLDEALLEIGVLATWLVEQVKRYPADRLRLRIACRTAQWPQLVEHGFRRIWGEENVRVFELAPLTAADARLAAEEHGVDPAAFFAEVARHDVSALANKPVTLRFLLDAFALHQALPHSKTELYRLGCLHLCDEDEERRLSGRAGPLTARERLVVARRIAAATIFGNRAAVWRGRDPTGAPSAEVPLSDLEGGSEPSGGGNPLPVTERELVDTLGTGLFSGRGETSLGWSHQTYAEFLAAQWIVENDLSLPQVEGLFRHPRDPERRFVPQLKETVAWLAGMQPRVRALVLSTEPELLLDSDTERLGDEERAALVDALLDATAHGRLRWPEFGRRRRYDRLAYPGVAEQLRPYLRDRDYADEVRELALEIARETGAAALQDECADMALDRSEPLALRVEAARVVAAVGDSATRARLLPLAVEPQEEDKEDDLKGTALRAVWPDHLGAEELFAALRFPKVGNRSGSYDVFLTEFSEGLDPGLLPAGLRWAEHAADSLTTRGRLGAAIVRVAWEHLDRPEVLAPFADLAAKRLAGYHDLLSYDRGGVLAASIAAHPDRRRLLVEALVERMGPKVERIAFHFIHGLQPLITREDFHWLLERTAAAETTDPHGPAWARLLRVIADLHEPDHFERLYARRDRPHVAAAFAAYWDAIPLDSDVAEALRRDRAELEEVRAEHERVRPSEADLPSAERVLQLLGGERGVGEDDTTGETWIEVAHELARTEDGRYFSRHAPPDQGPTWQLLDEGSRLRVLDAAERYVQSRAGSVVEWAADGGRTWGMWAGYRALWLLESQATERLAQLPGSVWAAWGPVIVTERTYSSDEKGTAGRKNLLGRAYAAAPEEVTRAARQLLLDEDGDGGIRSLDDLEQLWDEAFGATMLAFVQEGNLKPNSLRVLLQAALERNVAGALPYASSLLQLPVPRAGARRARALAAAEALLLGAPTEGWDALQPIIRRPGKLRRDLALSAAHRHLQLGRFGENQLAEIFAWLTEEFPYPDPWYVGVHSPSSEDEARRTRSDVMRALEARATPAAIDALERLRRKFPDLGWISQTVLRTREAMRRDTWAPPSVRQVMALSENAGRRLVQTGEQLLELLMESLGRLQEELQGELPSVSGLWDHLGRGQYRPKDEQELSDMIARHFRKDLRERGVVAGREVVIRRGGVGGAPGQRTDVYVTAVREDGPGRWDPVAAIVEVKGSWHSDVLTAMETQLADDYLARNPECRHGLYVVGWYLCERWRDEPGKRRSRRHGSAEALLGSLSEQAASLSTPERTVRAFVLDAAWQ